MNNIWNFIVNNKDILIPITTSLIAASISAVTSILISNKNSKKEIKRLEQQYELNFKIFLRYINYETQ